MSRFPDPHSAPADDPLARGGDLEPETLVDAYTHGIFPWPVADGSLYWWSPDPRCIIPLDGLHVSRSLRRRLRQGVFQHSRDQAFDAVVAACADRPGEGTWILPEMAAAYGRLHRLGWAHSVEVWHDGALVGGVYGVAVGGVFSGESMFHRATDASKVALVYLVQHLRTRGFSLFDTQVWTPHLDRMGAVTIDRALFLDLLQRAPAAVW